MAVNGGSFRGDSATKLIIHSVTAGQAGACRDQLAAVYRAAFADFEQSFPRHTAMEVIRLIGGLTAMYIGGVC